jgi:hypothetical protein
MAKGLLPKAYLRLDPNIDQTHPDNLDGFIRLLCVANRQPTRGRFRSRALLEGIFGKAAAKRFIARRDVVEQPDGTLTTPGWEEWQEGDWTVAERQRRIRSRRNASNVTSPLPDRDNGTPPASPDRDPPSIGSKAARQQGSKALTTLASAREGLPNITPAVQEAGEAITGQGILSAGDRQLTELDRLCEVHGSDAVVAAFRSTANGSRKSWRQLVWDSVKVIEPFASGGVDPPKKRQAKGFLPSDEEVRDAFER